MTIGHRLKKNPQKRYHLGSSPSIQRAAGMMPKSKTFIGGSLRAKRALDGLLTEHLIKY